MEEKYNSRLGKSYQAIIRKIASLYGITSNEAEVFYLKQKPALRKQLEEMVRSHFETVSANIKSAALEAWAFSSMMYDKEVGMRPAIHLQGQAAKDAVKAFNEAKSKYLADLDKRLSKRVWKWEKQFMAEIELSMQVGFKEGSSAAKLSRDVRQYLNNPEMLFRRVRDEFGQLHLSKAAAAYHPGQGVYRSSYKNALRMTGSEINRASRLSEHHRRLADPDVVGIEIKLSNNHTLNGVPFTDICDHLAGQYPKDFVFTGWHPKCRCKSTSILVTNEEFDTITDDILDGGDGNINSKNMVTDVPGNYKKWVKDNEERVLRSKEKGTLPYFLKENTKFSPSIFPEKLRMDEIADKLAKLKAEPVHSAVFVAFDPFSPIISKKLIELKTNKDKQKLLSEIVEDDSFKPLDLGLNSGGKTLRHPLHKGKGENLSWLNTKAMAKDINKAGEDVCFLPEYKDKPSADAIVRINNKWAIADFKHSASTNWNTLAVDLEKGFEQAGNVVLKLENADTGVFLKAMDYLIRNEPKEGYRIGDMKVINRLGKPIDITRAEFKKGQYKKKIRGHF